MSSDRRDDMRGEGAEAWDGEGRGGGASRWRWRRSRILTEVRGQRVHMLATGRGRGPDRVLGELSVLDVLISTT